MNLCTRTVIFGFALLLGCGESRESIINAVTSQTAERNVRVEEAVDRALRGTSPAARTWQEFLSVWPAAIQRRGFVFDPNLKRFRGAMSAGTGLEDRYMFKLMIRYEVSMDYRKVAFTDVTFNFAEVEEVVIPPEGDSEGGIGVTFQPDQKVFGISEWAKLKQAKWDFSILDLNIKSNAPIPGFQSALKTF